MAADSDDFEQNIENLKESVKKSFAHIYSSIKARELKTLRQLDAIRKQCQDNKDLQRNCIKNVSISYESKSILLENINRFGEIDFEKLSFDNSTFLIEEYVSPNDDHMYCYKTIEDLTIDNDENLAAIEEAALKQITDTSDCVCTVNIQSDEVSKKFRDTNCIPANADSPCSSKDNSLSESKDKSTNALIEEENSECSEADSKKIDPTDEWLNSIKNQTETEPSQATDVMEHSTIKCL
ncbi:uncharacterized protein LOC121731333 [Aricia agestis]|uniref:uncharacterized protein LOC121731333 n=1 Tax=Aricia agestis TaxID=91739 RepID=UPI001C207392|nr:uncharacterized protein LOC121731333 [Aricia agestis]